MKRKATGGSDGAWRLRHPAPTQDASPPLNNNVADQYSGNVLDQHTKEVAKEEVEANMKNEECGICLNVFTEASSFSESDDVAVSRLSKCGHAFHKACLREMLGPCGDAINRCLRCPLCQTDHGVRTGDCPSGYMTYGLDENRMDTGYPDANGLIWMRYDIKRGKQGPEHPSPGKNYWADTFPRYGYIPNNERGKIVLQLHIIAWERRLTFTVGTSMTTGADNQVIWNQIHHKTLDPGHTFPDPNYLDRAIAELAVQGVTEDDLPIPDETTSEPKRKAATKRK